MLTTATFALLFCLSFVLAAASDYLETRFVQAVGKKNAHAAARSSVTMWMLGLAALYTCVEISWLLALPEGAGLYLGTWFAVRRDVTA